MPNGSKLWRYRYRWMGKQQTYSIGSYPSVSLAAARQERDKAKKLLSEGLHPTQQRKSSRLVMQLAHANSFKIVCLEYIQSQSKIWDARYAERAKRFMEADVYPKIGDFPIADISSTQVLEILRSAEKRGSSSVAEKLRIWIGGVFRYAIATGRASVDPTYPLRDALHLPPTEHATPLDKKRIPALVKALDAYEKNEPYLAVGLKLLMLTFVRGSELRAATWDEVDMDNAEWRIPAVRMKSRQEHIVPLSTQALDLLLIIKKLTDGKRYLFPSAIRPNQPISDPMWRIALTRIGFSGEISPHSFRATASTMLNELGYESDWIERQLAHVPRNRTRASYNHAQYLPERRRMMQEWADYLDKLKAGNKCEITVDKKRQKVSAH
jgi:integrase